jgi:hypothetical protein
MAMDRKTRKIESTADIEQTQFFFYWGKSKTDRHIAN